MSDTDSTTSNWSASEPKARRSRGGSSRGRGSRRAHGGRQETTQATAPRTMHLRPASSRHVPGRYREDAVYPLERPSAVHPDPVFNPVLASFVAPGSLPMDHPGPSPSRVLYDQWLEERGLTHAEHIEMLRNGRGLTRDSIPPLRSRRAQHDSGGGSEGRNNRVDQAQPGGAQSVNSDNVVPREHAGRYERVVMDGAARPAQPWDHLPDGAKWIILKTLADAMDLSTAVKSLRLDLPQVLAFKKLYDREEQAWEGFRQRQRHHRGDQHNPLRVCTSSVDDFGIKKGVDFLNSIAEFGWANRISQLAVNRHGTFLPISGMDYLSVDVLQQAVDSGLRHDYHDLTPGALDWLRTASLAEDEEEIVDVESLQQGAQLDEPAAQTVGPVNERDEHGTAIQDDVLMSDPFVDYPQSADPPRQQPEDHPGPARTSINPMAALEGSIDGPAVHDRPANNDGPAVANHGPRELHQAREQIDHLPGDIAGMSPSEDGVPAHLRDSAQCQSDLEQSIPLQMDPASRAAIVSTNVREEDWTTIVNLSSSSSSDSDDPVAGGEDSGDNDGGLEYNPIPRGVLNLLPDTNCTAAEAEEGPDDAHTRDLLSDLEQSAHKSANVELAATGRATFGDRFGVDHNYPPFMDLTGITIPELNGESVQEQQQRSEIIEAVVPVDERLQEHVVGPTPETSATNGDDALRNFADNSPPLAIPVSEPTDKDWVSSDDPGLDTVRTDSHSQPMGPAVSRKRKMTAEGATGPRKRVAREACSSVSSGSDVAAASATFTPSTAAPDLLDGSTALVGGVAAIKATPGVVVVPGPRFMPRIPEGSALRGPRYGALMTRPSMTATPGPSTAEPSSASADPHFPSSAAQQPKSMSKGQAGPTKKEATGTEAAGGQTEPNKRKTQARRLKAGAASTATAAPAARAGPPGPLPQPTGGVHDLERAAYAVLPLRPSPSAVNAVYDADVAAALEAYYGPSNPAGAGSPSTPVESPMDAVGAVREVAANSPQRPAGSTATAEQVGDDSRCLQNLPRQNGQDEPTMWSDASWKPPPCGVILSRHPPGPARQEPPEAPKDNEPAQPASPAPATTASSATHDPDQTAGATAELAVRGRAQQDGDPGPATPQAGPDQRNSSVLLGGFGV